MSDQNTQTAATAEVPQVQLGFGRALTVMYGDNWRETLTEDQLNRARHFYHSGLNDLQVMVQISNHELSQRVHGLFSTLTVGAEKQIADAQAATDNEAGAKTKDAIAQLEKRAAPKVAPKAAKSAPAKTKGKSSKAKN